MARTHLWSILRCFGLQEAGDSSSLHGAAIVLETSAGKHKLGNLLQKNSMEKLLSKAYDETKTTSGI